MLEIKKDFSLKEFNTFHLDVKTSEYIKFDNTQEIRTWIKESKPDPDNIFIMGGGSNLLFTSDYAGTIIHPAIDNISIVEENSKYIYLKAEAGIVWDDFVEYCVSNSFYGVENLSLIPGNVGATPVQNIGAYGAEVKDTIEKVQGIFLNTGDEFSLKNDECRFGYRSSIFKHELRKQCLITSVVFRLSKKPGLNLKYGHLKDKVMEIGELNIKNIRKAVIETRKEKLPDPDKTGNAGSFFKNPEISLNEYNELKSKTPDIPGYFLTDDKVKVPAGWLIDKAGWKGKRTGNAGVHHEQALVLVNLNNATGKEILNLASRIEADIKNKFGIELEKEIIVI